MRYLLQHLHALPTVFTDGHLDAARTDGLAVGNNNRAVDYISTKFMTKYSLPTDGLAVWIELAEVASGAACGWGSFEFVLFRRCPYLSRHYGW
ncbi:hypothetical protein PIB30_034864 [Stylosanthes scabra]|uniref:Uncharacterized protein n=1 Tax=Stylosanthes scabra TaxID=79078 RepID=A0ABU6QCB9_9FABA|nr:hypothetical protein [Stylosanthes scabra]